jgi:hypothetical protein
MCRIADAHDTRETVISIRQVISLLADGMSAATEKETSARPLAALGIRYTIFPCARKGPLRGRYRRRRWGATNRRDRQRDYVSCWP